jgi:hypothetical protein
MPPSKCNHANMSRMREDVYNYWAGHRWRPVMFALAVARMMVDKSSGEGADMRSTIKLLLLLTAGMLAISGCSAVRTLLKGDSSAAGTASPEVAAEPSLPQFTFYESWASW